MTPSQQAKSVGLKSLTQVSQLTGVSLNTLTNWHRGKPELFRLVLLGCLADELSDTPVVVRWFGDFWGICHAKSYQSAFRRSVNRFATRGGGCGVCRRP